LKSHIKNFNQNQDYERLKTQHHRNNLFVDNEFAPINQSVYFSKEFKEFLDKNSRLASNGDILWKRAKDLYQDACLIAEKKDCCVAKDQHGGACIRCTDLNQGFLGNCWFVAAAYGIIENDDLFRKVVPMDNSFDDEQYSGILYSWA
jgi:hypothetical protein